MTSPVQATAAMDSRNAIAKSIHFHTRAMNRLLKKARAEGIRVALKVESVVEDDGTCWDVAVYGYEPSDRHAIVESASHLQAIRIKHE